MGKYRINEPLLILQGNKVVRHRRARNEALNINDDVAKKLGSKVSAIGDSDDADSDSDTKAKGTGADAAPSQQASKAAQGSQKGAAK